MTTLDQLRNVWELQYKIQCELRGKKEQTIQDNTFRVMYDLAYNELAIELNILDSYIDVPLTPVTAYTVYSLGANFGGLRGYELVSNDDSVIRDYLELKNIDELPTTGSLRTGMPDSYAIFKGTTNQNWYLYLYPLVNFTGSIRIRYKYIPLVATTGILDIGTLSVVIPDIYVNILLDGIMAQVFPDMRGVFLEKINRAILYRANPVKSNFEYELGGFSDE